MKSMLCALALLGCSTMALGGPCNAHTKIFMPAGKSATGETNYIQKEGWTSGTCFQIGRYDVSTVKICGPGKFSFSAMTCNKHDYKAVVVEESAASNTGQCTVQDLEPLPEGHMGSFTITC